jgi:hypothetical protein
MGGLRGRRRGSRVGDKKDSLTSAFTSRSPNARDRGHPLFFLRTIERRGGEFVLSHSSAVKLRMNGAPLFFLELTIERLGGGLSHSLSSLPGPQMLGTGGTRDKNKSFVPRGRPDGAHGS